MKLVGIHLIIIGVLMTMNLVVAQAVGRIDGLFGPVLIFLGAYLIRKAQINKVRSERRRQMSWQR